MWESFFFPIFEQLVEKLALIRHICYNYRLQPLVEQVYEYKA
jgi:hypothetical protein